MDFFGHLFDTSDFPARWHCGNWTAAHGWLHILSDVGVWSAYFAIPLVLGYFIYRRKDLPFKKVFVLFGAFILLCGSTHLMDAIIFWWPAYRLSGLIKTLTAAVSWVTVFALVRVVPKALAMRTPEELESEIVARKAAERQVREANTVLEQRVEERTLALKQAMADLEQERELLRTTLASIGDAVISTDAGGKVTFVNAVAESLTGWTNSEATGAPLTQVFNIVNEDTRIAIDYTMPAMLQDRVVGLANQTVLIAKDETERPIDNSMAPIRSAHGDVVGSVLVFRDVTERRRLERDNAERLQASQRLSSIVDTSNDAIICKSLEGTIQTWNASAERLFGYSVAEAVGNPISIIIPNEKLGEEDQIIARINEGKRVEHLDTVRVQKDGRLIHVSLSISPVLDLAGRIVGVSKIARDITDQKRAEEQIRYSEQLHRIAFDQSPTGMVYVGPDERFTKVNNVMCEITGYSEEELLQMKVSQLTHPDDLSHGNELIDGFLCGCTAHYENDKRYVCKDGSIKWVAVTARMVIDSDGHPLHSVCVIRDITDRKHAEERLRESEARYRALTEASATVVWQTNSKGEVVFAGDAWRVVTGQTDEQKSDWGWLDAIHPDDRDRTVTLWKHSLETRTIHLNKFRVRTQAGDYRWFSVRGVPVFKADGNVYEWIGANTDIHDELSSEVALRTSEIRYRRLFEAAHDGVLLLDPETRKIVDANPFMTSLLETPHDRLIGKELNEIGLLVDSKTSLEMFQSLQKTRQARFEKLSLRNPNAELREIELTANLYDEDGRSVVQCNVRDITERRHAEEALRESEASLRGILSQSPAGIVQTDAAFRMRMVNQRWCEMLGYSEAELLDKNVIEVTHSSSVVETNAAISRLVAGGPDFQIEKTYCRKDGSLLSAHSNVTALRSPEGEFLGLIAVILDITERLRIGAELREKAMALHAARPRPALTARSGLRTSAGQTGCRRRARSAGVTAMTQF